MEMRFANQTSDEKLELLELFVQHWLGPRQPEYGAQEEELNDLVIPTDLRRFYEFCYNWPGKGRGLGRGIGAFSTQNHLIRLTAPDKEKIAANHGLMLIAHEDQGVTHWAIPLGEDNPKVYEMDYGDETVEDPDWPYTGWHISHASVTDFLVEFCLYELFWAGEGFGLTALSEKLASDDSELELLVDKAMAYGHKLYLLGDGIMVLRSSQWKASDTWSFSARDVEAVRGLEPYNNYLKTINLVHTTPQENKPPRKWGVSINRDGSGTLYCSQTPKFLTWKNNFPKDSFDALALEASLNPKLVKTQSKDTTIEVSIHKEQLPSVESKTQKEALFLADSDFQEIFETALNSIENPQESLLTELDNDSPLT